MKRVKLVLAAAIFGCLIAVSSITTSSIDFVNSAPIQVAEDAHFG